MCCRSLTALEVVSGKYKAPPHMRPLSELAESKSELEATNSAASAHTSTKTTTDTSTTDSTGKTQTLLSACCGPMEGARIQTSLTPTPCVFGRIQQCGRRAMRGSHMGLAGKGAGCFALGLIPPSLTHHLPSPARGHGHEQARSLPRSHSVSTTTQSLSSLCFGIPTKRGSRHVAHATVGTEPCLITIEAPHRMI